MSVLRYPPAILTFYPTIGSQGRFVVACDRQTRSFGTIADLRTALQQAGIEVTPFAVALNSLAGRTEFSIGIPTGRASAFFSVANGE